MTGAGVAEHVVGAGEGAEESCPRCASCMSTNWCSRALVDVFRSATSAIALISALNCCSDDNGGIGEGVGGANSASREPLACV